MKRRTSRRDNTLNERYFVVTYRPAGTSRDWEIRTTDERRAVTKAAKFAAQGLPVRLRRHLGLGLYEDVEIPAVTQ